MRRLSLTIFALTLCLTTGKESRAAEPSGPEGQLATGAGFCEGRDGDSLAAKAQGQQLTDYVNPFIGTSNFGATNPGAVCPNGMMSVSPFNVTGSELNTFDKDARWWSTPYSSDDVFFTGFSHVNLSGVGCPELGTILTLPSAGRLSVDNRIYGSTYTDEIAHPGYYALRLASSDILAEATASARSSIERYTYHEGPANVIVNLGQSLSNESGAWIRRVSDNEIEGMRLCGSFCYNPRAVFPQYFFIRVCREGELSSGFWKKQPEMTAEAQWDADAGKYRIYPPTGPREIAGDDIGAWFSFDAREGESVIVQVGVSFVSAENARANLEAEQEAPDFDAVRQSASDKWEKDLGKIRVKGGSERDKIIFYTALYHCLIHPNILNDVNGEYPLMEGGGRVGKVSEGHNRYTVFSLWDTCRNLHQLLTLVYPERQTDMIRSMVDMYREWGWMPKWELFSRETFTMEGDPAIPVIVDSYLKGLRDFDADAAYEAFLKSADSPGAVNPLRPDNDPYLEKGYIPLGYFAADFSGDNSVSHALEYYMADAALARFAEALGKKNDAKRFRSRSLRWTMYYSKESGTLRPINADGSFLNPFNPRQGENFEAVPGFHEGSAWNYTFYIPHDFDGMVRANGGKKAFTKKLWKVFQDGLYDPSNEPDIAYPYLFSRISGEEWRTGTLVRKILNENYGTGPDGLPGNDDCGTMSAWAVFSMMGFYPDCPGEAAYTLTEPVFDSIEIGDNLLISKDFKHKQYRVTHAEFLKLYEKN